MTIHATWQQLLYKLKAKGRHGIHSPFVYAFVEHVLQDKNNVRDQCNHYPGYEWLDAHYSKLLDHIIANYHYKNLLCLPLADRSKTEPAYDILLINTAPENLADLFTQYFPLLTKDSVVLIYNIHKTPKHTTAWQALCADPKVLMSIDLYGVGLFFFKEEFKEKQHFVLKY